MSSSLQNARLTKGQNLKPSSSHVLPCPECGKLAMKRVRGPCTLRDGTVIPDLERFQCSRCRANFFDDAAMQTIAEFRRHSSKGMNHKVHEAQIFRMFLRTFPSLRASVKKWEQPKNDPPDILCHIEGKRTVGFELTRWLHQKQIGESKPAQELENRILAAIGEQGENPTDHIRRVMPEVKQNIRRFDSQDSENLKEEMYQLITETDRSWPKYKEWHTTQGYRCAELDRYPTLKKYFSHVYFDPIQVGSKVREKLLGSWIMFPSPGGFYSPEDAWEALRQTIRNKVEGYKNRKNIPLNIPLDLVIYYGEETLLYNTLFQDISVRTFADASKIAAEIIAAELQGMQHPFKHVYLLKALGPKPEAFCVYPEYQECR